MSHYFAEVLFSDEVHHPYTLPRHPPRPAADAKRFAERNIGDNTVKQIVKAGDVVNSVESHGRNLVRTVERSRQYNHAAKRAW